MKKNYIFILAGLLSLGFFTSKAQAPVPDILHYKFNGTGSLVTNYASTPPIGTATGTMLGALTQTGAIGCNGAVVGSGISSTTDFVNTGWVTNFPSTGWTISFWSNNIQPSATLYYIFGDVSAGSFRCFTNGIAGAGNWILRGTGITDVLITGAATTTANMVTYVYNQTASVVTGYINGVQTVAVTQTAVPTITSATGPFKVIGYSANVGLNAGGLIGDYRIYGSALTATQVLAIYNETTTTPTISIAGANTICANQTATLTANGFSSYLWNTSSTNTAIIVTPSVTTSYTVVGGAGTCTNTAVSTITVNPSPTITVTGGAVCAGGSFTLNPTGATSYSYSPAGPVVTPTANASYTVTGIAAGCSSNAIATVTVNASPTITIASGAVCTGGSYTLNPSGATTYSYLPAGPVVSPSATATYSIIGTNSIGCSSNAVASVTVNALPTVSLTSPQNTICVSGPTIALTGSPSGGVYTGSFVTGNVFAPANNSGTFTQTYAYTNTVTNCSNTATNTIVILNCTGLNASNSFANALSVYPNPNTGLFTIELNNGSVKTIEVMDVTGRIVLTNTTSNDKIDFNISTLSNGVYYLRVQSNNSVEVVKVVKQ